MLEDALTRLIAFLQDPSSVRVLRDMLSGLRTSDNADSRELYRRLERKCPDFFESVGMGKLGGMGMGGLGGMGAGSRYGLIKRANLHPIDP